MKNTEQKFKPYDFTQTEDFWSHIYHDTNYDGYIYFCIKNKDQFRTLYYCKANNYSTFLRTLHINPALDYYYTPHHFRVTKNGVKRDGHHIFAYTCCVIDIDCHKKLPYTELSNNLETYIKKLDSMVELENHIPYNIVLKSGRGLQLIYIYQNALSYKVDFKHKQICDILLKQHEEILKEFPDLKLSLDSGSTKRCSGVFRMPHTYNPKSVQEHFVTYNISNYPYLDVDKVLDTYYIPKEKHIVYEINTDFRNDTKVNVTRCKKVIKAILQYVAEHRAAKTNPGHENRTCTLFVLSPFLLALYGYNTSLHILLDVNNSFVIPLHENRVKQILEYCLENYNTDEKCKMRYFKNSTIIDYLGIESGDYDIYATDDFIYNPCFNRISKEERALRRRVKEERNTSIYQLLKQGISYKDIATQTNISLSTVYRLAKTNAPKKERNPPPWEKMGISKSTYYRRKKKS